MFGALDAIMPVGNSRALAAMLGPGVCRLVVLPTAGRSWQIEGRERHPALFV